MQRTRQNYNGRRAVHAANHSFAMPRIDACEGPAPCSMKANTVHAAIGGRASVPLRGDALEKPRTSPQR
jgi:hypothetical protein